MGVLHHYNFLNGMIYAQSYALFYNVPEEDRLFYYSNGENCTNFISQCVWAAYGGWLPGFSEPIIGKNAERIKNDYAQVRGIWYGSKSNIGSNRWCRVEEFYSYCVDKTKTLGPKAEKIAEGDFFDIDPAKIREGDVIQMVVASYTPDRFGHGLFVIKSGTTWDDILICCNSDDRLNEPMSWFSQFPDIYKKLRVLRFSDAIFEK